MNKRVVFLLGISVLISGCGTASVRSGSSSSAPAVSLPCPSPAAASSVPETTSSADGIDIDLTALGSNMVYAQVYQMSLDPTAFEGQVVRVNGIFSTAVGPENRHYYFVYVSDAAACCSQGLEFIWDDGEHLYPEEYPAEDFPIQITGVFETYTEANDPSLYFRLVTDSIDEQ